MASDERDNPNVSVDLSMTDLRTEQNRWMLPRIHRTRSTVIPFILFILLLITACSQSTSPFILQVSITSEPIVGALLDYHASLRIVGRDMPNTTIEIEMPQSVTLVEGISEWKGDLVVGETIELDLKLRVKEPGQWLIITQVLAQPNPETSATFGTSNRVLLISGFDQGQIVDDAHVRQTGEPCGPDLSCGSPPAPPSRPLVTVTPTP